MRLFRTPCLLTLLFMPSPYCGAAEDVMPPVYYAVSLLNFINSYRIQHGMPGLMPTDKLTELAREHSLYMAERGDINHDGFEDRYERSRRASCVENVGWNYRDPYEQFKGWQSSPEHNAAMLNPRLTRGGIAVFDSYVTFFACS